MLLQIVVAVLVMLVLFLGVALILISAKIDKKNLELQNWIQGVLPNPSYPSSPATPGSGLFFMEKRIMDKIVEESHSHRIVERELISKVMALAGGPAKYSNLKGPELDDFYGSKKPKKKPKKKAKSKKKPTKKKRK